MGIALTELSFLLRSAQNCKESIVLDNLRTITQEKNIETRQISSFSSSPFSTLFITFIPVLKIATIRFYLPRLVINFSL